MYQSPNAPMMGGGLSSIDKPNGRLGDVLRFLTCLERY